MTLVHGVDHAIARRSAGETNELWRIEFVVDPGRDDRVRVVEVLDASVKSACDDEAARNALVRAVRDVVHRELTGERQAELVAERFRSRR
jgi:hypothetical protein